MKSRFLKRLTRIRRWVKRRFVGWRQSNWPRVRRWLTTWLSSIGSGALLTSIGAELLGARQLWVFLTAAITLICLGLTIPLNWKRLRSGAGTAFSYIRNYGQFILVIVIVVMLVLVFEHIIYRYFGPPEIPERQSVAEILNLLSKADTEKWTAVKEKSEAPKRVLLINHNKLIATADPEDMVRRVYIKDTQKIAEDERGPDPYSFSRKYFDRDCNYAIDYFDSSRSCVSTEYRKNCKVAFERFDCAERIFFPPPMPPVFGYR